MLFPKTTIRARVKAWRVYAYFCEWLVCVEIDCEASFGPCSKVCIKGRGFSCEMSNSPGIALCPFEITDGDTEK